MDESAITGESAPVIREAGRPDRRHRRHPRAVRRDRRLITAAPGETFLDRMIALVEGASRRKTPNEIALSILLSSLTLIFLLAVATVAPMAAYAGSPQSLIVLVALLVCLIPTTIGALLSAIGIAGMDRLVKAQRAGDVRPGRRGRRRRRHPAARQNRDHHVGQPAGEPLPAVARGRADELRNAARLAAWPTRRPKGARWSSWRCRWGRPTTNCPAAPTSSRSPPRPGCPAWTCPLAGRSARGPARPSSSGWARRRPS